MPERRENFVRLIQEQIKDPAMQVRFSELLDSVVFKDELKVVTDELAALKALLQSLAVIP